MVSALDSGNVHALWLVVQSSFKHADDVSLHFVGFILPKMENDGFLFT